MSKLILRVASSSKLPHYISGLFFFFIGLFSILCLSGFNQINTNTVNTDCVEGNLKKETVTRELTGFDAVSVDGVFNVNVVAGQSAKVTVSSESNILPHILTKKKNTTLFIYNDTSICPKVPIVVNIHMPEIKELISDGVNDILVQEVAGQELIINLSGAGNAAFTGKIKKVFAQIEGTSVLKASKLEASEVNVEATEATSAVVYATQKLVATSRETSEIFYLGNPAKVTKNIEDIGEIIEMTR